MWVPIERDFQELTSQGLNRDEAISAALERGILAGQLAPGTRLPTVRGLSSALGVSGATVAAAYRLLGERGWTRGEVGRGTYVVSRYEHPKHQDQALAASVRKPWRRRAVLSSAERLRALYPDALDCTSGKPDPALLPSALLSSAWQVAVSQTAAEDLQYATPEPARDLDAILRDRLQDDGIGAQDAGIMVGSSAQQLMILALSIVPSFANATSKLVAVEEPGYQTVFDAIEYSGYRLTGMDLDEHGVRPESLARALGAGARTVLFTPRAQNPTGASWTTQRRLELTQVIDRFPGVVVIEDDQFAELATSSAGSMVSDPRTSDRTIYIRSFSKSIAPDLRISIAAAKPRLLHLLSEAKSFTDGWSPRLSQRTLAALLADPLLNSALDHAKTTYASRRTAAMDVLKSRLEPVGVSVSSSSGLSLWIQLAPGMDATSIVERAAANGVLVTPGEPFFIRPGRNDVLRLSVSAMHGSLATTAAERLADAVIGTTVTRSRSIPI